MLTYNDVTDLVMRAKQFEELATIDGLTGLYNRRHFDVLAEAEWKRFQRYRRPLSLFLIDIDQFKEINDRRGQERWAKRLTPPAQPVLADDLHQQRLRELRVVEDPQPDRLEGRNRVGAVAVLQ